MCAKLHFGPSQCLTLPLKHGHQSHNTRYSITRLPPFNCVTTDWPQERLQIYQKLSTCYMNVLLRYWNLTPVLPRNKALYKAWSLLERQSPVSYFSSNAAVAIHGREPHVKETYENANIVVNSSQPRINQNFRWCRLALHVPLLVVT